MKQQKVSIIVPFYNSERYVNEILTAILGQTFKDIEAICVDDGSTDNTLSLLKNFKKTDSRVRVISHEHQGAGAARNRGIKEATGKYIVFLDADDAYRKEYIKEMYYAAESNDADLVICWFCMVDTKTRQIVHKRGYDSGRLRPNCSVSPSEVLNLFHTVEPHPYNKMWRRELIMKHGIQFSNLPAYNDHLFTYSALVSARSIVAIDKELCTYRIYNNPDSISTNREKHVIDFLHAEEELYDWLNSRGYHGRYLETYLSLWRRHLHTACRIANDHTFTDAVVDTLMNKEPWQSMSDRKLQREAGLQTVTAKLRLKMNLWKIKGGVHEEFSSTMIRQSENEINNIEKIIQELTLRGKRIRGSAGLIRCVIWMFQDRGIHDVTDAARRMLLK